MQKWREMRSARLLLLWYSVARGRQQENSHRQVGSARASPLAVKGIYSCVCCFVLLNRYWGIMAMKGLEVSSRASQESTYPRLKIADAPPHPDLPETTWGGRILTFHLNYVAGYTNPLLFLFERTQPLTPFTVCVTLFLLNRYWGIVTVPGSFLKTGDLGWPDPHPSP